ncbi:hypothetical protein HK098_005794 [Nowakowskiella sp. JEL0407]|nr:hypothetical protein HK098_005794 [Nowakowskiella sp. JEL0407]
MTEETLVLVTGITGFLGSHVASQLLASGYRVRGTLRSLSKGDKVYDAVLPKGVDRNRLELFEIDLLDPSSKWELAVKGCTYIQHVASPLAVSGKDEDFIKPAVEGTLSIFKAALNEPLMKRIVMTSSIAAINLGRESEMDKYSKGKKVADGHVFGEDDWANLDKVDGYVKSKILAERAAWDFVKEHNENFSLAVINPGLILGPYLLPYFGTSVKLSTALMKKEYPAVPGEVYLQYVDVRDVAFCQIKAMTVAEAANHRHIASSGFGLIVDYAKVLQKEFSSQGYRPPTAQLPYFVLKLASYFDQNISSVLVYYGKNPNFNTSGTESRLGVKWRSIETSIIDLTYSLIELGHIPKTPGYKPRSECKPVANLLYHRILSKDSTREVFWDEQTIPKAVEWKQFFLENLNKAFLFIPLISSGTLRSFNNSGGEDNVLLEWDRALDRLEKSEIIILPVFLLEPDQKSFDFDDVPLHTVCAKDCSRSFAQMWNKIMTINGLQIDFSQSHHMVVLDLEINRICELCLHPRQRLASPSIHRRKGIAIPPLRDLPNPENYIDREDIWSKLDKEFEEKNVAILRGVGGSGKTFAATNYAFRMVNRGHSTFWMKADNHKNVVKGYREYVDWAHLSKNKEILTKNFSQLLDAMTDPYLVQYARFATFIVLDNVNQYSDVSAIINAHSDMDTKFLITTRVHLYADVERLRSIEVSFPDEKVSEEYLRKFLSDERAISTEECIRIIQSTNRLPLRLATAAKYLKKYKNTSVDRYLSLVSVEKKKPRNRVDDDIYPEVSLSIDDVKKNSKAAFRLLSHFSYLNPDSIVINLVCDCIDFKFDIFDQIVRTVNKRYVKSIRDSSAFDEYLSLITDLNLINCSDSNSNIVTIHRCIQADIRERVESSKHMQDFVTFTKKYEKMLGDKENLLKEIRLGNTETVIAIMTAINRLHLDGL